MEGERTLDPEDHALVVALRAGDEQAFRALVDRHHAALVGVAMIWVRDRSVAEEVAQETWLGVLKGIERFEERSSLKTWIFRILANRARTRGEREARTVPLSSLGDETGDEPSVSPDRFVDVGGGQPGPWALPPESWAPIPDDELLSKETRGVIDTAIAGLPPRQAEVITLRDVQGLSPAEVAEALDLSEGNQRVLLHRARSKVRAELERHWATGEAHA